MKGGLPSWRSSTATVARDRRRRALSSFKNALVVVVGLCQCVGRRSRQHIDPDIATYNLHWLQRPRHADTVTYGDPDTVTDCDLQRLRRLSNARHSELGMASPVVGMRVLRYDQAAAGTRDGVARVRRHRHPRRPGDNTWRKCQATYSHTHPTHPYLSGSR